MSLRLLDVLLKRLFSIFKKAGSTNGWRRTDQCTFGLHIGHIPCETLLILTMITFLPIIFTLYGLLYSSYYCALCIIFFKDYILPKNLLFACFRRFSFVSFPNFSWCMATFYRILSHRSIVLVISSLILSSPFFAAVFSLDTDERVFHYIHLISKT